MIESPAQVGVLTFHRCINFGSYWQARCLVEGLRAMGHDARLLDHHSDAVVRAEWKCALQPTLPARTLTPDLGAYKAKARKFVTAIEQLPRSATFALDDPEALAPLDAVVVGSDEVWNFRHPWYASTPLFFGEGLTAPRLVSYAASFGNHDAADGIGDDWVARLRRFTAISVRDANAQTLVGGALGETPPLVLDPVLQFGDRVPRGVPEGDRYALVYGHGFPDWLAEAMRQWANRHDMRLHSIGYRNDWADTQEIDAGPEAFAERVAGASALVTNFFHGCVFALVHGTPFVTAPSSYRFNKVRDLAAALDAQRHIVAPETAEAEYDMLLSAPHNPQIGERIAELRAQSTVFLGAALG
ncbi:polysaccharide pyruvyl transferase family protein [Sphingomonas sp. 8AM]|uniref:polysaccharide pyruvyl transferase family protein n=1 Tax=Sphingomonas sp. 8AM TaxID=2653170 RepID=UPI0012F2517D|nr:polysaccharide pyruvyl transferase family protein [Sphingomonas sp. 8AM]VXC84699.1 Polysaccharide pyruvyl transferase [Sphingomonas sp. 8AM]